MEFHLHYFPSEVHKLIIHFHEENMTASGISRGRPSPFASQLSQMEVKHSQHLSLKGKQWRCHVCSLQKRKRRMLYFRKKCDVGLCVVNCFETWHMRVNLGHLTQKVALTVVA